MKNALNNIPISEIVAKTKHLEIKARKMVNSSLQNDYKSSFKGRGMEFDEVRTYNPGDNVRDIDWNVTARMNEPFIKTFIEERELLTYFIVDISASENFGSIKSKRNIMAEVSALLGFTSFFANDKTGLILATNKIEKSTIPRHSYSNILQIIRDIAYYKGQSRETNLNIVLRNAYNIIKKKSIIFVFSDFFDQNYENALGSLAQKHEVIPIVFRDSIEENFVSPSFFPIITEIEDIETSEKYMVSLTKQTLTKLGHFSNEYKKTFSKLGLDYAEIDATSDYVKIIDRLLRKHAGRKL